MKKIGQVTIFFILGIVILVFGMIYFYAENTATSSKSQTSVASSLSASDSHIVNIFAESCIKIIAEEALFDKIAPQGGYLEVVDESTKYLGNNVPFWLQANCHENICDYSGNIPALDSISNMLSSYLLAGFEECFGRNKFNEIGLVIIKRAGKNAEVSLNRDDVTIKLTYPLTVKKGASETSFESFIAILPIRLKTLHESSQELVNKIANSPDGKYSITEDDCSSFDKNGLTNAYIKNSDDNSAKIIQFVDFSTYYKNYVKSFIFQYAVKNIDIAGSCS